jgi:hypothetical protein
LTIYIYIGKNSDGTALCALRIESERSVTDFKLARGAHNEIFQPLSDGDE